MATFKFYGREKEMSYLETLLNFTSDEFVYISGRRRIGKTSLIKKVLEKNNQPFFYFFCSKDLTEKQLVEQLVCEINLQLVDYLPVPFSSEQFHGVGAVFKVLLDIVVTYKLPKLVMVWDEFQNLRYINKAIYSDFQQYWDMHEKQGKIKTFFLGSHYTLMKEIFINKENPLYGRATGQIRLTPFPLMTQAEILSDYGVLSPRNLLLAYGTLFGVPKYMELFFSHYQKNTSVDIEEELLDNVINPESFFINEMADLLLPEFGGSYTTYVGILSAIASGKTKRNEIANFTGIEYNNLGSYINKLIEYYDIISKHSPLTDRKLNSQSYSIDDYFLNFYFSFIFKNQSLIEIQKYDILKERIKTGLSSYLGGVFEGLVKEMLICINNDTNTTQQKKLPFEFHNIGSYWDKKGENEIDIVCVNEEEKNVLFVECKINTKRINETTISTLKQKVATTGIFQNYKHYYGVASLDKIAVSDADVCFSVEEYIG